MTPCPCEDRRYCRRRCRDTNITGGDLVIEASSGDIGTTVSPNTIGLDGKLILPSNDDVFLEDANGTLNLASAFAD